MPWTRQARKIELMKLGRTQADLARELGVDPAIVCHVLAGSRTGGGQAAQVREHVAKLFGLPTHEIFPGVESPRRRATDRVA